MDVEDPYKDMNRASGVCLTVFVFILVCVVAGGRPLSPIVFLDVYLCELCT